jgi:hypothetical protein
LTVNLKKKEMSYYSDLLKNHNNRYTKAYYGGVPLYLKFKTAPSDKTSLTSSYRLNRSVESLSEGKYTVEYNAANGTTLKTVCMKTLNSKIKAGNNAFVYDVSYKPEGWNNSSKAL